jgi:hypothetical protein
MKGWNPGHYLMMLINFKKYGKNHSFTFIISLPHFVPGFRKGKQA